MAHRTVTIAVNDRFMEELDQAVQSCQTAQPYGNYSRHAFMKAAITRAIAEVKAKYGVQPRGRIRERSGAAA